LLNKNKDLFPYFFLFYIFSIVMKKIIIMIVKFYQFILSPDHSFWAKSLNKAPYCKHFPTCSDYMIQSIENRGVIK